MLKRLQLYSTANMSDLPHDIVAGSMAGQASLLVGVLELCSNRHNAVFSDTAV
jgi:hypothetical protein